jgi:hypothetical protein
MLVYAHHEGLLAEAIRSMARELHEHDAYRRNGMDEVLDRTVQYLFNRLGRWPTAAEAAAAAGVSVEDVVEERLRGRPAWPASGALAAGSATPGR